MPEVELTEEERADIQEYLNNTRGLSSQINALIVQRDRLMKAANTTWRSAYQRAMLNEQLPKFCTVPELIDREIGRLGVTIQKQTVSWGEDDTE